MSFFFGRPSWAGLSLGLLFLPWRPRRRVGLPRKPARRSSVNLGGGGEAASAPVRVAARLAESSNRSSSCLEPIQRIRSFSCPVSSTDSKPQPRSIGPCAPRSDPDLPNYDPPAVPRAVRVLQTRPANPYRARTPSRRCRVSVKTPRTKTPSRTWARLIVSARTSSSMGSKSKGLAAAAGTAGASKRLKACLQYLRPGPAASTRWSDCGVPLFGS